MLAVNDWMDPGTKEYALIKAEQMLSLIGYPDFLYNDTQLDDYYKNFDLHPNDHYALQVEKASIWSQRKAFRRLIEPVDREDLGRAALLLMLSIRHSQQPYFNHPFFDRDFPKATNYGCIGAVIGHEITHGFDDQGAQFDGRGNLKDWWDPLTQKRFVERKAYAAYQAYLRKHGQEKRLPGLEKYNNEQLFFISYAQTWCGHTKPETLIRQLLTDPHSPYRYRVNGVVVNQPEFTNAFKCQEGAAMRYSEERRCSVW
uniref:Peptidase M13 C-terminal domain-containing protein n=1 Tax=Meloidogyne enterolobii TaxID=390850 RepID=A0A6V7YAN5_MELEN|nr:unnamed protein product [Meloidogyne enterolobii]